jgi:hypothetical protein
VDAHRTVAPKVERAEEPGLLVEALRIVAEAGSRGIVLRLTGSLAVRHHCPAWRHLLDTLDRAVYRDIDLVGYSRQTKAIIAMFQDLAYTPDRQMIRAQEFGIKRLIFERPERGLKVDVFLDDLVMAHTVHHGDRLELDAPTVSLVDLLLSKLQIHEVTENDLKDMAVLLAEHPLGDGNVETIDLSHILDRMRRDWCFCHELLKNVDLLEEALGRYTQIPEDGREVIRARLRELRDRVMAQPKTTGWKLRARLGTRVPWYEEVGQVDRR